MEKIKVYSHFKKLYSVFFIVVNGQKIRHNLPIWSHWISPIEIKLKFGEIAHSKNSIKLTQKQKKNQSDK